MTTSFRLLFALILLTLHSHASDADSIYTIGNSLTWDTKPYDLEGDVDYHIFCGKNLRYIYDNPDGHCVGSSLPWTVALNTKQYDWISVQPFAGTTLTQDIDVISNWMTLQPTATFILHPAWSRFANFPNDYTSGNPDDQMRPSPEYISDLISGLEAIHPGRQLRSTKTNDLLYSIYLDTQNGVGPFGSLADLSRDAIHMGHNTGRYFAHNALRLSMDQPISSDGFTMDPAIESYFNGKLTAVPEPNSIWLLISAVALLGFLYRRREKGARNRFAA